MQIRTQAGRSSLLLFLVAALAFADPVFAQDACGERWLIPESVQSQAAVNAFAIWDRSASGYPDPLLVLAGKFSPTIQGHFTGLATWNGVTFAPLDSRIGQYEPILDLTIFRGDLIACGYFTSISGVPANYIARWDGSAWHAMGSGMDIPVYRLAVYRDRLIAGGRFQRAGDTTVGGIASWDGSSWTALGTGIPITPSHGDILAVTVSQDQLFVGGEFDSIDTVPAHNIARWDGVAWHPCADGTNDRVLALTDYAGQIAAAGDFTAAGAAPAKRVALWNGQSWSPLGSGLSGNRSYEFGTPSVGGLGIHKGDLIVGGDFAFAGGQPAFNVARWNGSAWGPLGSGIDGFVATSTDFAGELWVGGAFATSNPMYTGSNACVFGPPRPQFVRQPSHSTVCPQGSVSLEVEVAGVDPFTYAWRKNGIPLQDGSQSTGSVVSGSSQPHLSISNTSQHDEGVYDCVVTNACQSTKRTIPLPLKFCGADFTCDGQVDDSDFVAFAVSYDILICSDPSMSLKCPSDLNGDGMVDDSDFVIFAAAYDTLICP